MPRTSRRPVSGAAAAPAPAPAPASAPPIRPPAPALDGEPGWPCVVLAAPAWHRPWGDEWAFMASVLRARVIGRAESKCGGPLTLALPARPGRRPDGAPAGRGGARQRGGQGGAVLAGVHHAEAGEARRMALVLVPVVPLLDPLCNASRGARCFRGRRVVALPRAQGALHASCCPYRNRCPPCPATRSQCNLPLFTLSALP